MYRIFRPTRCLCTMSPIQVPSIVIFFHVLRVHMEYYPAHCGLTMLTNDKYEICIDMLFRINK